MYRCCIFDLDGTLVNSIYAISHTVNLTLEEFGLGPIDEVHAKKFVGDGYQMLIRRSLLYCGDSELEHYGEACSRYLELFRIHCMHQMEVYDGIDELLSYIKGKELRMAILSNKPHDRAVENVEGLFGTECFDIIMGEKPGGTRKPDPAGALEIARQMEVEPSECLYIGDTDTDMITGAAAGMDTVAAAWGFRERGELESFHPKYMVNTPCEVVDIIRRNASESF